MTVHGPDRTGRVPAVVGSMDGVRPANTPLGDDGLQAPQRLQHQHAVEGAIPWGWNNDVVEGCQSSTKSGEACKAHPVPGTPNCPFHSKG